MSRPTHSFSPYTGNPYIYYNGVPIDLNFNCRPHPEHPRRTIIRTNDPVDIPRVMSRSGLSAFDLYEKQCFK